MTQIAYPENDLLERAIRAQGLAPVAGALAIGTTTLRAHCVRQGLPTKADTPKVHPDALKRLAEMVA